MIDIFLGDNYDKGLLKVYLKFIKKSASRELKYGTISSRNDNDVDVFVRNYTTYSSSEIKELSSWDSYLDDLVTHISENGIGCYLNGVMVNADVVLEYIEEM